MSEFFIYVDLNFCFLDLRMGLWDIELQLPLCICSPNLNSLNCLQRSVVDLQAQMNRQNATCIWERSIATTGLRAVTNVKQHTAIISKLLTMFFMISVGGPTSK